MTSSVIHLDGNIGPGRKDGPAIEVLAGQSGNLYCRFSVATTERKKDSQGNWSDGDTSWWNCTAFGQTAEMIAETLDKGDPVMLHGKVKVRKYESNGEQRQSVDVTVDSIGLNLSRAKRKTAQSRQQPQYDDNQPPPF